MIIYIYAYAYEKKIETPKKQQACKRNLKKKNKLNNTYTTIEIRGALVGARDHSQSERV